MFESGTRCLSRSTGIWRNRSADDTWSGFLSKIGGHTVPRRSLELYLSEYDKDKEAENKFYLGNDISKIFKWAEGGKHDVYLVGGPTHLSHVGL